MSATHSEPDCEIMTDTLANAICVVLQSDKWIAQLFDLPLASDLHANKLSHLFSIPQPQIKECTATAAIPVQWADIARIPIYAPTRQEDGSYHLLLPDGKILVKLSKFDHDLMVTEIPRKVVDPKSYPCDMSAEIKATRLAKAQITLWKDLLLESLETAEDLLSQLSIRQQTHEMELGSRDISPQTSTVAHVTPLVTSSSSSLFKSHSTKGEKRKGRPGHDWSPEEENHAVEWFQHNRGLTKPQIVSKYYSDTGIFRSYKSLQTRLYLLGHGHLTHKKRKASSKKAEVTGSFTSNMREGSPVPLSKAINRIMGASETVEFSETGQDSELSDSLIEGMGRESSFRLPSHHGVNTAEFGKPRGDPNDEGELTRCLHLHENKQLSQEQPKVSSTGEIVDPQLGRAKEIPLSISLSEVSGEYPISKIQSHPRLSSENLALPGISSFFEISGTWGDRSDITTGRLASDVETPIVNTETLPVLNMACPTDLTFTGGSLNPPLVAENSQSCPSMSPTVPQRVPAVTSTSFSQSSLAQSSFTALPHKTFRCLQPGCEHRNPYKYKRHLENHARQHHN